MSGLLLLRLAANRRVALYAVIAVFVFAGIYRAAPFADNVSPSTSAGDDWLTYKLYAMSVIDGGLAMPGLQGNYGAVPHGFLYVYFLAGVFALVGVNSAFAYIAQSALLGLSVVWTALAFSGRLRVSLWWCFVGLLTFLAGFDVFRALTFRLLSENLYLPLAAAFWWAILRRHGRVGMSALAGILLGATVLTRPSTVMAAGVVVFASWWFSLRQGEKLTAPIALVIGVVIGISAAPLRDFAATGHLGFQLVSNTNDWITTWHAPLKQFLATLGKRIAFAIGWADLMVSAYRPRPHWMMVWALAAVYPLLKWRHREPADEWEVLVGLYVLAYIGPVILVADIASYGGRMVVVILPLVAALAMQSVRILVSDRPLLPR